MPLPDVVVRVLRQHLNRYPVTHPDGFLFTDDQGNAQPAAVPWNAQGYGYNVPVPHPVKVA